MAPCRRQLLPGRVLQCGLRRGCILSCTLPEGPASLGLAAPPSNKALKLTWPQLDPIEGWYPWAPDTALRSRAHGGPRSLAPGPLGSSTGRGSHGVFARRVSPAIVAAVPQRFGVDRGYSVLESVMRRASLDRARTVRVWRAHLRIIHDGDPGGCLCELQPGRFRKGQRRGGCGKPRCYLCKREKLTGEPTRQELRAATSEYEWSVEFGFFAPKPRRPW